MSELFDQTTEICFLVKDKNILYSIFPLIHSEKQYSGSVFRDLPKIDAEFLKLHRIFIVVAISFYVTRY